MVKYTKVLLALAGVLIIASALLIGVQAQNPEPKIIGYLSENAAYTGDSLEGEALYFEGKALAVFEAPEGSGTKGAVKTCSGYLPIESFYQFLKAEWAKNGSI
ncbi:MAG: hypothetical protein V1494_06700 [Candidatus Diapherotrites archaeon]